VSLNKDSYLSENIQEPKSPPSSPASSTPPGGSKPAAEEKKPPADEIERAKKKLLREINRIDICTNSLVDNGLFDNQKRAFEKKHTDPDKVFEDIQKYLKEARTKLYDDDLSESEYFTSKALRSYDQALYAPSRLWRFSNVYGGAVWIYLIGFLAAVLAFYFYLLDAYFLNLNPPGVLIQEAALHATTWGTVGAILRGIWYLKDKVSDRKYRNSLRIYFLSAPFLGGLFGAILYFMIVAGLFIIAPAQAPAILLNQTSSEPNATQTGSMTQTDTTASTGNVSSVAIIPLAALAGFNWEWAIIIFKRIGDSFKGEMEPDDKIEK
jgi:hypothetical protein